MFLQILRKSTWLTFPCSCTKSNVSQRTVTIAFLPKCLKEAPLPSPPRCIRSESASFSSSQFLQIPLLPRSKRLSLNSTTLYFFSLHSSLSLPDLPIEVHIRPKDPSLSRSFDKSAGSCFQSSVVPRSASANPVERERRDVRTLLQFLLHRAKPSLPSERERFEPSFLFDQHGGRANQLVVQLSAASSSS